MDNDAISRRRKAALAGHLDDESAALSHLRDPQGSVRATALAALHRMGKSTESQVRDALQDPDATVRRRACAAAIHFPDLDLVPLLQDSDPSVVEQAAWALGERGESAGDVAVAALSSVVFDHEDALCRESAVAALGAIGDEAGLPAILKGTTDKPAIRRRAVIALAPFSGPDVEAAFERAKSDRDWQVRQAAEDLA